MHLQNKEAKVQLRRLKGLSSSAKEKKKNKISGYFRKEPYEWVAFDNRSGNMWIGYWQQQGECINWLDNDPG